MEVNSNTIVTLKDGLSEIVKALDRIDGEKEAIKDILKALTEKTDVPKKYIRKMAVLIQKSNVISHRSEMDEFKDLLDMIVGRMMGDKQE